MENSSSSSTARTKSCSSLTPSKTMSNVSKKPWLLTSEGPLSKLTCTCLVLFSTTSHVLQAYVSSVEINATINEIKQAYDGVAKWAKPESAPFSMNFAAMKPVIRKEPKGTVLIISPFNYPLWLSFGPVAGAIAAWCTVVLKPSEVSPAVSALMTEVVSQYVDKDVFRVVNGAIPESTKLLELQWDHSAYTFPSSISI